jgi:hypothetical protein
MAEMEIGRGRGVSAVAFCDLYIQIKERLIESMAGYLVTATSKEYTLIRDKV